MKRHLGFGIVVCILCIFIGTLPARTHQPDEFGSVVLMGSDPTEYLVEKALRNRLLLIGTRHKDPLIHQLITSSLPELVHKAGINTLFVEIPSSQQVAIDQFLGGTSPVEDIGMWSIIGCSTYSGILLTARDLGLNLVAMDKPEGIAGSRDAWMGNSIQNYLQNNPGAHGLVVVGVRHILKGIRWADYCEPSLADHLSPLGIFSVVMWPDAPHKTAAAAMDVDPDLFYSIKDPTLMSMNILPEVSLATTADGVIFLP